MNFEEITNAAREWEEESRAHQADDQIAARRKEEREEEINYGVDWPNAAEPIHRMTDADLRAEAQACWERATQCKRELDSRRRRRPGQAA